MRWIGPRRKDEAGETGWTGRLRRVGHALDGFGAPLRDVAIAVDGDRAHAMALVWRATRDTAEWAPVTAAISLIEYGERGDGGPWAGRLGVLGAAMDRRGQDLREPSVMQVEGGFVVSALVPAVTQRGHGWNLVTWEVGVDDPEGGQ